MTDWTAGYVADIGYTHGYYGELNPLRLRLAFLHAGLVCPEIGTACELGFGQGLSANIHATASTVQWHGTDFNPAQAAMAQELAAVSGSGAQLLDEGFAEFCARSDLPDFDFIGLHGIWSWISDENRHVLVDFIRCKLKVGGVLFVSYNTMPGWAGFAPLRHLMTRHAEVFGVAGKGSLGRVEAALEFAQKLLDVNPGYARANPQVAERLDKVKGQNKAYLAHEYFNRDWHPMHFATLAEWLAPAKLSYACSAYFLDHVASINLTTEQQAMLNQIPDVLFRESTRDFMINQQFRRDYWVKGARKLPALEQAEALRNERVVLLTPRADIKLKIMGVLGEARMTEEIYNPILDCLANHQMWTLGQLEQAVASKGINARQMLEAMAVLVGAGHLTAAQDEARIAVVRKRTATLNRHLALKARSSADIAFLASPVLGGGFMVNRFPQLFLLAMAEGRQPPADLARFAWELVAAQGQKMLKEGKMLETAEDNLAELSRLAKEFTENQLPILQALQITQGFTG